MNLANDNIDGHLYFYGINLCSEPANTNTKNIVFVHGFPGRPHDFRWLIPELTNHNLYFVALPGQGYTDRDSIETMGVQSNGDFIERCISHWKLEEFYIVGHSMGGAIGSFIAQRNRRCKGLILLSSVGIRPHKAFRRAPPQLPFYLLNTKFSMLFQPLIKWVFVTMGFPKGIDTKTIYTVLEHVCCFSFTDHHQDLKKVLEQNLPIMIVYAKNDPLIEKDIFEELCEVTSPTLILAYEDGGHNPQKKHAKEIGIKINQILQQP